MALAKDRFSWSLLMLFCLVAAPAQGGLIADSVAEFSGIQGLHNWHYGYIDPATSLNFIALPQFNPPNGPWFIAQTFPFLACDPGAFWTQLTSLGGHPNGRITSGCRQQVEHWAVRRWVSEVSGPIDISGRLFLRGPAAFSDGIEGKIWVNGTEIYSVLIGPNDTVGVNFQLTGVPVNIGESVDFVVTPGPNSRDGQDTFRFPVQIHAGPITTNVTAAPNPVKAGNPVTLTATVSDASTGGTNISAAEYSVDGGAPISMSAADGAFDSPTEDVRAATAPFSEAGFPELCVHGADAFLRLGPFACAELVVFDPDVGFVTAGGAVDSPENADRANPAAEGRATFGLNVRYLPRSTSPSGNLEFQFSAGDINFRSAGFNWLVVTSEPRARFQGTGNINGTTSCKFKADVWDGSYQPGNLDALGLEIYDCGGMFAGPRYELAVTPLLQGSAQVHR